jgi:hypothetical protein
MPEHFHHPAAPGSKLKVGRGTERAAVPPTEKGEADEAKRQSTSRDGIERKER